MSTPNLNAPGLPLVECAGACPCDAPGAELDADAVDCHCGDVRALTAHGATGDTFETQYVIRVSGGGAVQFTSSITIITRNTSTSIGSTACIGIGGVSLAAGTYEVAWQAGVPIGAATTFNPGTVQYLVYQLGA